MKELQLRVWCDKRVPLEEINDYILCTYPKYKISGIQESLFPDILEDGTKMYCYFVMVERG